MISLGEVSNKDPRYDVLPLCVKYNMFFLENEKMFCHILRIKMSCKVRWLESLWIAIRLQKPPEHFFIKINALYF